MGRLALNVKSEPIKREYFASAFVIFGFTAFVILILVLFFPKDDLLNQVDDILYGSQATAVYLNQMVAAYPNDSRLRVLLAGQQIRNGEYQKARANIRMLLKSDRPAVALKARWLDYELLKAQTFQLQQDDPVRKVGLLRMKRDVHQFANAKLSDIELENLADDALRLNEPKLSLAIYKRLVNRHLATHDTAWFVKVAQIAVSVGDYPAAGRFYFYAMRQPGPVENKRIYFLAGLDALQQGGLQKEALVAATKHIGPLANDKKTLVYLARLAHAAGRPDIANEYIKRAIKLPAKKDAE